MPAKKPTKSRTAQTGLKKKVHVPVWAIIVGVVVIASIGIAVVYNSYASGDRVYCRQGYCSSSVKKGANVYRKSACQRVNSSTKGTPYLCKGRPIDRT